MVVVSTAPHARTDNWLLRKHMILLSRFNRINNIKNLHAKNEFAQLAYSTVQFNAILANFTS